jgi:hypothetical protein
MNTSPAMFTNLLVQYVHGNCVAYKKGRGALLGAFLSSKGGVCGRYLIHVTGRWVQGPNVDGSQAHGMGAKARQPGSHGMVSH